MKGDFSRFTFDPTNHHSRVLMQQGRVLLDADWNESAEIQLQNLRDLAVDLMGPHAAAADPNGNEGTAFLVASRLDEKGSPIKNDFSVGEGRYYVQGIPCTNPSSSAYRAQSSLPDDKLAFDGGRTYLAYLDVWERHVTAAETDVLLDEPALSGADTCTRSQIVWQIRTQPFEGGLEVLQQDYQEFLKLLNLPESGTLAARVDKSADPESPCIAAPESKYRGNENQLYRVEIHTGGEQPTFKWSRDNGSQIYPVVNLTGAIVTLQSTGHDDLSNLQPDDMVELIDDQATLLNQARPLSRVSAVNREDNQVTLDPAPAPAMGTRPYLRRWNSGEVDILAATAASVGGWISLEDGVQVQFTKANFVTGQYWTIPARTVTGDVLWPQASGGPASRAAQGIGHAYAPLAVIAFKDDQTIDNVVDLRRKLIKLWK